MKKETEEWTENLLQLLYEWMRLLQKESEIATQMELLMEQKKEKDDNGPIFGYCAYCYAESCEHCWYRFRKSTEKEKV